MITPDKQLIERRFGAAASTYDKAATPQIQIADILMGRLSAIMFEQPHCPVQRALEIGCGTGIFSQRMVALLGYEGIEYHFNDLSPAVEEPLARKLIGLPYTFEAYDAEHQEWGSGYDLISSSSCIQWWHEPLSFLHKAHAALNPQGIVVLSTFLPENLQEIHSIQPQKLNYPSEQELAQAFEELSFTHYEMQKEVIPITFHSILELLRHLKETGTNALQKNQQIWTPSKLHRLEAKIREEQNLTPEQPLTLTYQAIIATAVK